MWQTQEPQGLLIVGTRKKEGERRGWRHRPLATCGVSGPPRAARREAPVPQRLRMLQGVTSNARQQWVEAYTMVGHKVLDACANGKGAGSRADVLQAVQKFGNLARTVFPYSRSRRSGAAAAMRATQVADGLQLEDAGGEEEPERTRGLRRPQLSDEQRQAARLERLHLKRSVQRAARVLQDSQPADVRDPRVRASFMLRTQLLLRLRRWRPWSQQPTREQTQEVVGIVSARHWGTAAGPSEWMYEIICAACQPSDAADVDVTLELVNLILSRELPRETFLLDTLLIGLKKPGGGARPIAISKRWY